MADVKKVDILEQVKNRIEEIYDFEDLESLIKDYYSEIITNNAGNPIYECEMLINRKALRDENWLKSAYIPYEFENVLQNLYGKKYFLSYVKLRCHEDLYDMELVNNDSKDLPNKDCYSNLLESIRDECEDFRWEHYYSNEEYEKLERNLDNASQLFHEYSSSYRSFFNKGIWEDN